MIDLAWQIPVFGLAGAMAWRIIVAPYELWKEQKSRADRAESGLSNEAKSASLTIEIGPDGSAKEIANANIFSWKGEVQIASYYDKRGKLMQNNAMGHWFFAVWFDKPVFDYVATIRAIGNDRLVSTITWQTARGFGHLKGYYFGIASGAAAGK